MDSCMSAVRAGCTSHRCATTHAPPWRGYRQLGAGHGERRAYEPPVRYRFLLQSIPRVSSSGVSQHTTEYAVVRVAATGMYIWYPGVSWCTTPVAVAVAVQLQYGQEPDQPPLRRANRDSWCPDSCPCPLRRRDTVPAPVPSYPRSRYAPRCALSSGSAPVASNANLG